MKVPNFAFVIDLELNVYELEVGESHYCYRKSTMARFLRVGNRKPFRSLRASEAVVRIGHDCFVISHACVLACHCPGCGADVGNLCFGSGRQKRRLKTATHYQRRDLFRAALCGRSGN